MAFCQFDFWFPVNSVISINFVIKQKSNRNIYDYLSRLNKGNFLGLDNLVHFLAGEKNCFSGLRESVQQKMQKNFFENWTINCRRAAHQNWPKIIYSLIYSTSQDYTKNAAKAELLNWLSSYGAICTYSYS